MQRAFSKAGGIDLRAQGRFLLRAIDCHGARGKTRANADKNPMKIVLAFGDDTFYAAAGENGAKAIKRLIDSSVEAHAAKLPLASGLRSAVAD